MNTVQLAKIVLVMAAGAIFAPVCGAQAGGVPVRAPYPVQPVPEDVTIPYRTRPLPRVASLPKSGGDNTAQAGSHFIVYRAPAQMSREDRAWTAKSMPAIREAAAFAGMEFGAAQWSYRQLDCRALPGHLFLLFANRRGPGDTSRFTASISRAANGRLRILPVERRGDSLFALTPTDALALAFFSRIRAEEPESQHADWLATSLCYAALTVPDETIALSPREAPDTNLALSFPPSIELGRGGDSTVRFVNVDAASPPFEWTLNFNAKGDLVAANRFPVPAYATRVIPKK